MLNIDVNDVGVRKMIKLYCSATIGCDNHARLRGLLLFVGRYCGFCCPSNLALVFSAYRLSDVVPHVVPQHENGPKTTKG